ncbi:MAG TPA: PEGA domain-containing protein, partial [Polyangia bacterium]
PARGPARARPRVGRPRSAAGPAAAARAAPELRAPAPEPFEQPQPPPPAAAAPAAPRRVSAARPAVGGTAPRQAEYPPTAPARPGAATGTRRAPQPAPRDIPDPPDVAAAKGMSAGGKLAIFATIILLGGAGAGALLLYNPDAHQPRRQVAAPSPGGSLYVTSKPAGAAILIDGKPTGRRTPDTIDGLPLRRAIQLELQLDGYQPWSLEMSVTEDEATPVMAELTKAGGGGKPKRR